MIREIEFVDIWGNTPDYVYPVPAVRNLPDWYRKTEPYVDEPIPDQRKTNDNSSSTIKRCNPVFDAITAGYLLLTPVDINVRLNDDGSQFYEWPSLDVIRFHPVEQNPNYPGQDGRRHAYPKFNHPWLIKTPPGYSTYFMPPAHRGGVFKILEGFVDTDVYHQVVELPFVIDPNFEGLIPAATPMAQVIPIKRESWRFKARERVEADLINRDRSIAALRSVFNNAYRNMFWHRKQYR